MLNCFFFLLFVFWKKLLVPLFANNEKLQVDLLVSTTPATLRRLLLSDKLFLSTIMHCVRLVKRKIFLFFLFLIFF